MKSLGAVSVDDVCAGTPTAMIRMRKTGKTGDGPRFSATVDASLSPGARGNKSADSATAQLQQATLHMPLFVAHQWQGRPLHRDGAARVGFHVLLPQGRLAGCASAARAGCLQRASPAR
jgi:hypothetical protein